MNIDAIMELKALLEEKKKNKEDLKKYGKLLKELKALEKIFYDIM